MTYAFRDFGYPLQTLRKSSKFEDNLSKFLEQFPSNWLKKGLKNLGDLGRFWGINTFRFIAYLFSSYGPLNELNH